MKFLKRFYPAPPREKKPKEKVIEEKKEEEHAIRSKQSD